MYMNIYIYIYIYIHVYAYIYIYIYIYINLSRINRTTMNLLVKVSRFFDDLQVNFLFILSSILRIEHC